MKKFLIMGNQLMIINKELLEAAKELKIKVGNTKRKGGTTFYVEYEKDNRTFSGVTWWTNLNTNNYNYIFKNKDNNKDNYTTYDDYNAINIEKSDNYPDNYYGCVGTPISFILKFDYNKFEIIDLKRPKINNKKVFSRLIIKRIDNGK